MFKLEYHLFWFLGGFSVLLGCATSMPKKISSNRGESLNVERVEFIENQVSVILQPSQFGFKRLDEIDLKPKPQLVDLENQARNGQKDGPKYSAFKLPSRTRTNLGSKDCQEETRSYGWTSRSVFDD